MSGRIRSVCLRAVAVALLAAAPLLAPSREASAHAELVETSPANGAHLDGPPAELVLRFSEPVAAVRGGVRLLDGGGRTVAEPAAHSDGSRLRVPLPGSLGDGAYVVSWRVLSADSHPVHGAFVFSVGAAQAAPLADAGARAGADRAVGVAFWVARLLGFAGLALLVGGAFFVLACWPAGRTDPGVRRLVGAAWVATVASAAAALLLQGPNALGTSLAGVLDPALLLDTARTRYGALLLARIALLLAIGALLLGPPRVAALLAGPGLTGPGLAGSELAGSASARSDRPAGAAPSRARLAVLAVLGVALVLTWSGAGHAAAGALTALAAVTDATHLLAMAVWLGGLVVLSACVLRGRRPDHGSDGGDTVAAATRFSRWAGVAVAVLAGTGLVQSVREFVASGLGGQYLSLLIFKIGAFGLLLWLGALSRSVVRRRLAQPAATAAAGRKPRRQPQRHDALAGLRRSVRWEASIAAVVLGLAAALVATPPGGHDHGPAAAAAGAPAGPFLGALTLPGSGDVQVWVDPARPGNNQIVLNVRDGSGINRDVPEVQAQLRMAGGEVGPLPVSLARTAPGQFVANAVLVPIAGTWALSLRVRTTDFDETTVEAQIPVGQ